MTLRAFGFQTGMFQWFYGKNSEVSVSPTQSPLSDLGQLPSTTTSSSLVSREVIPENNRDAGLKYSVALEALRGVLNDFPGCEGAMERDWLNSKDVPTRIFLRKLDEAVRIIKRSDLPIREQNEQIIHNLREAVNSDFYREKMEGYEEHCALLRRLCYTKFAEVYPQNVFNQLVENAAKSANPQAMDCLLTIDKNLVGSNIRAINQHLHHAQSEYRKGTLALWAQKARGEFGGEYWLVSDPCGTSNVPYLRSRFNVQNGSDVREIAFCRFGTPTIQASGKTVIDPMFLCALDAMHEKRKNFLYVNHQKLDGREGVRSNAIAAVQRSHENFHFLSIPLDGLIVDSIRRTCPISELKDLIHQSFMRGTNGCQLPTSAGISSERLTGLLEHVHTDWFAGKTTFTQHELEAFWGIFNTTLKHCMIKNLEIHVMNSSCKDNKDRGGTLGTIDEAVRNVLLGHHENPVRLQELVHNALAPYMIKLECILDNPEDPGHHRLGFLISVLDHIATMNPVQIQAIRNFYGASGFAIAHQELSPGSKRE